MKKDTLFFLCLSLLALGGMLFSTARAQETAECAAPEGVTATVNVTELYATDFKATLTMGGEGACDGQLVFVADNNQVAARPEDGKTYSAVSNPIIGKYPDSVGGFAVKIAGTQTALNVTGLRPATTHYIYVYPYTACETGGPLYQQTPSILEVTTIPGGPEVETAAVTAHSVTFNFPGWTAGTKVLVGVSRRDCRKDAKHYVLEGISGKAYAIGDTLYKDLSETADDLGNKGPYAITAVHNGALTDGRLTVDGLEAGTPYYFYFWTVLAGENQYSTEYVEAGVHTVATAPHTFTFATDRVPVANEVMLPAGWSSSADGMNARFSAGLYQLKMIDNTGDPNVQRSIGVRAATTAVSADVITPYFQSTHASFDVCYNLSMQTAGVIGGASLGQMTVGDTLTLYYRTEGQTEWTMIERVTAEKTLAYAADDFAGLKANVPSVATNQNIQLRFVVQLAAGGRSARMFVLNRVLVEPHLSCAYPENIAVFDSLTTHKRLGLRWQLENEAASVVFRYRPAGQEAWSAQYPAQNPTSCFASPAAPLLPNTAYEVALQTVCRPGDSSLVKTVTGRTLKGLPYAEDLTDLTAWPSGFASMAGSLPASEDEAATLAPANVRKGFKYNAYNDGAHTRTGVLFSEDQVWLTFPPLCLEDMPVPAVYTFQYQGFYNNTETGVPEAIEAENPFRVYVLVSKDGSFRRADIVDTLTVKDMKPVYQTFEIDLSAHTGPMHLALYVEKGDTVDAAASRKYFVLDSCRARYTAELPCFPVENIRQYDLTASGITLSWSGFSYEYGIMLTNEDKGVTDTVYTTETTYTFSNLEPGTLYTYRIQAYCDEGHRSPSALSAEGFFSTQALCEVPTEFAVVGTTWQSVTITAKSSVSATKLIHVWAKDEQYASLDYYAEWQGGRGTITLNGLLEALNITYYVSIRSICAPGDSSAWAEPLEFTTDYPECGAPVKLQTLRVGEDYAELSWEAGKNNDYYWLMYRPASRSVFDTLEVGKVPYRISDLKKETAYVWQLQAVCDEYLVSATVKGADFTTEGVAVELTSRFQGLKVGSDHGRIAVWNTAALPIDRVEVYALTGRQLYGADFGGTTDHLLLPSLGEGSRMVLVRIFSAGETGVYKIVLL